MFVDVGREGSSPLSRGIPVNTAPRSSAAGIIPALAGNTHPPDGSVWRLLDHPRSRGEYALDSRLTRETNGSSPLSRGIPRNSTSPSTCSGIIPALAGNTATPSRRAGTCPDHPRSRGEYSFANPMGLYENGSSPLSRGIPGLPTRNGPCTRIIPALAGNTSFQWELTLGRWDHPRSRGEYSRSR